MTCTNHSNLLQIGFLMYQHLILRCITGYLSKKDDRLVHQHLTGKHHHQGMLLTDCQSDSRCNAWSRTLKQRIALAKKQPTHEVERKKYLMHHQAHLGFLQKKKKQNGGILSCIQRCACYRCHLTLAFTSPQSPEVKARRKCHSSHCWSPPIFISLLC